jgi:hypothetical protein
MVIDPNASCGVAGQSVDSNIRTGCVLDATAAVGAANATESAIAVMSRTARAIIGAGS